MHTTFAHWFDQVAADVSSRALARAYRDLTPDNPQRLAAQRRRTGDGKAPATYLQTTFISDVRNGRTIPETPEVIYRLGQALAELNTPGSGPEALYAARRFADLVGLCGTMLVAGQPTTANVAELAFLSFQKALKLDEPLGYDAPFSVIDDQARRVFNEAWLNWNRPDRITLPPRFSKAHLLLAAHGGSTLQAREILESWPFDYIAAMDGFVIDGPAGMRLTRHIFSTLLQGGNLDTDDILERTSIRVTVTPYVAKSRRT